MTVRTPSYSGFAGEFERGDAQTVTEPQRFPADRPMHRANPTGVVRRKVTALFARSSMACQGRWRSWYDVAHRPSNSQSSRGAVRGRGSVSALLPPQAIGQESRDAQAREHEAGRFGHGEEHVLILETIPGRVIVDEPGRFPQTTPRDQERV